MLFRSKHSAKAFKYGHFLWERKHTMTNTIRLKISCFLLLFTVLLIKDILDLAWHLATRMKFGTNRIGTYMGPFQGFGPNWNQVPNLGHHYEHCSCYLNFFFSETKFSKTETFFRDQILQNQNRNPQQIDKSLETKNFRNRNVNLW